MTRIIEDGLVDVVTGALVGVIDVEDGPTDEHETLGYEYAEFYRRNGLGLPGDDAHIPLTFVSHDMCHVIGGYELVGVDEIALGGMQLAVSDTDVHWLQLLGNLACTRPDSSAPPTWRPGWARWLARVPPTPLPTPWLGARSAPATSPAPTTSPWPTGRSPRSGTSSACPRVSSDSDVQPPSRTMSSPVR